MRKKHIKILVYILIISGALSIGWFLYSSNRSTKEIPKRAIFVDNRCYQHLMG